MKRKRQNQGMSLVEVMIVVGIIGALAAIATPGLLRSRQEGNGASAKAILATIASSAEEYAANHHGNYPSDISELTSGNPPYLNEDYTNGPRNGYNICCSWSASQYACNATPVTDGVSAYNVFEVKSGLVLATYTFEDDVPTTSVQGWTGITPTEDDDGDEEPSDPPPAVIKRLPIY